MKYFKQQYKYILTYLKLDPGCWIQHVIKKKKTGFLFFELIKKRSIIYLPHLFISIRYACECFTILLTPWIICSLTSSLILSSMGKTTNAAVMKEKATRIVRAIPTSPTFFILLITKPVNTKFSSNPTITECSLL